MTLRIVATVATVVVLAFGLGACGEKPQSSGEKGTTVTRDTKPWEGDPLAFQGEYKRGDKASWEHVLQARQQTQNEYIRIGGK